MQKTKIKDIVLGLNNLSMQEVLEFLVKKASGKASKTFVVTVNPEIIVLTLNDSDYEKVINSANLRTVDGIGVVLAGKLFGKSFKERIHGVDLIEKLCEAVAKQPITVGFLGGGPVVAELAAECLMTKYPGLRVAFAVDEADRLQQTDYSQAVVGSQKAASSISADILFVAFGSPKQEKWIFENLPKLDVRIAIGVGGSFDFISGRVRRAPKFIRSLGLEWLFRLIIQPWRIKRQLKLLGFLILLIREKLSL